MKPSTNGRYVLLLLVLGMSACASLSKDLVRAPQLQLLDVQVLGLGFKGQTFMLSFDVANPNPFPLPVRNVAYGVRLDGQRFASGETSSEFTVPANGDARFSISVDLDLLTTAPQLLSIVRHGVSREIPYQIEGRLGVDIPLTPSLKYENRGNISINAATF